MSDINSLRHINNAPRPPKKVSPPPPPSTLRMSASEYKQYCNGQEQNKNQKASSRGKKSQKDGKMFEKMLEDACEKYREDKVAKISKAVEPYRNLGALGGPKQNRDKAVAFRCVKDKQAEPDFKGILATGLGVAFEAKHTDHDRIEWSVVEEHQRQHLEEQCEMNGLAFVMVSFGFKKFFRIPWGIWRDMKKHYGRKYIRPEEIGDYEVPVIPHYGKPAVMFLEGVEALPVKGSGEK